MTDDTIQSYDAWIHLVFLHLKLPKARSESMHCAVNDQIANVSLPLVVLTQVKSSHRLFISITRKMCLPHDFRKIVWPVAAAPLLKLLETDSGVTIIHDEGYWKFWTEVELILARAYIKYLIYALSWPTAAERLILIAYLVLEIIQSWKMSSMEQVQVLLSTTRSTTYGLNCQKININQ